MCIRDPARNDVGLGIGTSSTSASTASRMTILEMDKRNFDSLRKELAMVRPVAGAQLSQTVEKEGFVGIPPEESKVGTSAPTILRLKSEIMDTFSRANTTIGSEALRGPSSNIIPPQSHATITLDDTEEVIDLTDHFPTVKREVR